MSVLRGNGYWIHVNETDLTCPVCTAPFNAGDKMNKAKFPIFKMKCPACKSPIGIRIPIFGGTTQVFEWNTPPHVHPLQSDAPFTVNGIEPTTKEFIDNQDDDPE